MVRRIRTPLLVGMSVALALAGVGSYYASGDPDGLERVAADQGFDAQERDHLLADSPLADYTTRGVDDARWSGGMSGVAGVGLTFVLGGLLFVALRRRPDRATGTPAGPVADSPSDPAPDPAPDPASDRMSDAGPGPSAGSG